jgi:FeS assembly SUF system regulator
MIRLTKLTDYGFVMLTLFARGQGRSVHNAPEIAAEANVPLPTASKILKMLARDGLLIAHRGVKGGYQLARLPQEITVSDVIQALEGPISITECSDTGVSDCGLQGLCPVSSNWQRINQVVFQALRRITLAELCSPDFDFSADIKTGQPAPACGCGTETASTAVQGDAGSNGEGACTTCEPPQRELGKEIA